MFVYYLWMIMDVYSVCVEVPYLVCWVLLTQEYWYYNRQGVHCQVMKIAVRFRHLVIG